MKFQKILLLGLLWACVACSGDPADKQLPFSYRHGMWHFHAMIWTTNANGTKTEPHEAIITLNNQYITHIESGDSSKKTDKNVFKPVKIAWDDNDPDAGSGTFRYHNTTYHIQLNDEMWIHLPSDDDTVAHN